jgi:hypothetical protein
MSPDVKQLQDDLIQVTRDLAGAGDTATGQVNPEDASGRAILAVQQANRAPMTEQKESFKRLVEDVAKIDIEMIIVNSVDGVVMEEKITDPVTGEDTYQMVQIPQVTLENVKATVKIDITPKSVYDRFAQEQTLENLLMNGLLNVQRLPELEAYVNALPDDAVAPKQMLLEIIDDMKDKQRRIAMLDAQSQMMKQRMQTFLMGDPDEQSSMMADAQMQLMEQQYAQQEAELDKETAEAEAKTEEE